MVLPVSCKNIQRINCDIIHIVQSKEKKWTLSRESNDISITLISKPVEIKIKAL